MEMNACGIKNPDVQGMLLCVRATRTSMDPVYPFSNGRARVR